MNTVCFDKTGTLTEDELVLTGVLDIQNRSMGKALIQEKNSNITFLNSRKRSASKRTIQGNLPRYGQLQHLLKYCS